MSRPGDVWRGEVGLCADRTLCQLPDRMRFNAGWTGVPPLSKSPTLASGDFHASLTDLPITRP